MKTTKAAKRERRERRASKRRHQRNGYQVHALNGTLDPGDLARLSSRLETLDPAGPWEAVAPHILPILKRIWYPYPTEMTPFHLQVPPGIPTGFGIDLGPAFSHATPQLIERWGIDHATLLATALANLRSLVRREPPIVDRLRHAGMDITAVQGQGWGSALLLLPEVLTTTLGDAPAILLAPVRNTLLAIPETVEPETVVDLWGALADGARDALDLDPMRWTGTTVVALNDLVTQGLPN